MAYVATITNTRTSPLMLYYRPYGSTKDQPKPLIQVLLPSRALNYQVTFTDELYFKAFKEQNAAFINNKTIVVEEQRAVKAKKDAIVSNPEKSTSDPVKKPSRNPLKLLLEQL